MRQVVFGSLTAPESQIGTRRHRADQAVEAGGGVKGLSVTRFAQQFHHLLDQAAARLSVVVRLCSAAR